MIRLRRGTVVETRAAHAGRTDLVVDIGGARADAVAYDQLVGPLAVGDVVVCNTTAVELDLGTGGVHLVVAVEGRDVQAGASGHAMKLRYSPHQIAVHAAEEGAETGSSADGMPVVIAGLHSALVPAAIGIRAVAPNARIAYVMTDGASLVMAFSATVPAARAAGLIDVTISAGQAAGGDLEAVNVYSALVVARAVAGADVAIVAMGPGNLGTGSPLGFALMEVADIVNACDAVGARAVVAPRLSFADPRERHEGVSHHTRTALRAARAPADVVLPPLAPERAAVVRAQLRDIGDHAVLERALGPTEAALESSPVPLRSMGRGYRDDPDAFRAAAAAGMRAADLLQE
ncbi:MAG TPA: DUF3866 family protein [Actinomycetota bacterium]|nr:DUF3866 family protein [Actinomycetota bacterium]